MNCEDGVLLQAVIALLGGLGQYTQALSDAVFFCTVREYLIEDMLIGTYRDEAAARLGRALGMLSTTVVTGWVLYQGFMVLSGANRQPMMGLLYKTGKLVFILSLVSVVAGHSPVIADTVLDFQRLVTVAVVGEDTNVYRMIDLNLGLAQVINQVINNVAVGRESGSTGNSLTTAAGLLGQSGPAMITTVLALLAEIAITFAILLAPLFLFFLLFQQTSSLFWSWAKFLLGTFVSLAALAVVSSIALRMSAIYGASVLAAYYTNASNPVGSFDISGSAMRMATLGTLISAIIISIPPMVMQFFNAGVGFATGAMGGMMGGAAAGRMAGGGTGIPGFGYAGGAGGGAGGSAGGRGSPAVENGTDSGVRQLGMTPTGRTGADAGSSTVLAPGARGLAAQDSTSAEVRRINHHQSQSDEYRGFNDFYQPPPGSRIGQGGELHVSGSPTSGHVGGLASNGASGGASGGGAAFRASSGTNGNGGRNGNRTDDGSHAAGSPPNSDTPTHQAPPPQAPSARLDDQHQRERSQNRIRNS